MLSAERDLEHNSTIRFVKMQKQNVITHHSNREEFKTRTVVLLVQVDDGAGGHGVGAGRLLLHLCEVVRRWSKC